MKVRPGCTEVRPGDLKVRGRGGKSCPGDLEVRGQQVKVRLRPGKSCRGDPEVRPRQVKVRPSNLEVRPGDLKSRDPLPEMGLACSETSQNHLSDTVIPPKTASIPRVNVSVK